MDWLVEIFKYPDSSQLITGTYDLKLVFLSILTAILSSFMSLQIVSFSQDFISKFQRKLALFAGSVAMGTGVWSMHFIGMLTFNIHTPVTYRWDITLVSILPSIIASAIALNIIAKPSIKNIDLIVGGVLVGSGIGVMHYMGMAAMQMSPMLRYDFSTFCLSIIAAVSLSIVSLWIRFGLRIYTDYKLSDLTLNIVSAVIMGTAISTMHYIGMFAARFVGHHDMPSMNSVADNTFLAFQVAVVTLFATIFVLGIHLLIKYRALSAKARSDEQRLQAIMSTAIHGVVTINAKGDITTTNRAITQIIGWDERELLGQNITMLLPDDHASEYSSYLNDYMRTKIAKLIGEKGGEVKIKHKDGHRVPIHLSIGHVKLAEEDLFVGFIYDISQRVAMEKDLREKEEKYRTLIANIPGAAYRCQSDNNWQMLFVSHAIESITGYTVPEFLSTENDISFGNIIHPDDTNLTESILVEAGKFQIEYRIFHQDGSTRWVLDAGECIKDDNDRILWLDGFMMDITERKIMETQLLLEKEKAEQAAATKSNFLANMSHEIRTPMNAILGFSEILLEADLTPVHHKHLSTISNSALSLLHLIDDILDSAKIEKDKLILEMRHFSLHQLVDLVISSMWLQARKKSLDLKFNINNEITDYFYGAEDRIRQVLVNLLGNAIKFTHKGYVDLDIYTEQPGWLTFKISDTGIGVAPERLQQIFEPFTQADASMTRRFGGTGLGTTICKQLVELMGGEITASSIEGQGSCFSFKIPLAQGHEDQVIQKQTQVAALEPMRLLIADDIPQNLELLQAYFESNGHTVTLAKDGQHALDSIKTQEFDVILMDVQMPQMDGHTASKEIIAWEKDNKQKHTPIIAVTASVLNEDKIAAKEAGMDGFASKPVNFNKLCIEIARVTERTLNSTLADQPKIDFTSSLINVEQALSLWQSPEKYLFELQRFLQNNQSMPEDLNALLVANEPLNLIGKAHALRGVTANLAIKKLEEQFLLLEDNIKSHQFPASTLIIERIKELIQELQHECYRLDQHMSGKVKALQEKFDDESFIQAIETLIIVAKENRFDQEALTALKLNARPNVQQQVLTIENTFEDFDFNIALNLLDDLKSSAEKES